MFHVSPSMNIARSPLMKLASDPPGSHIISTCIRHACWSLPTLMELHNWVGRVHWCQDADAVRGNLADIVHLACIQLTTAPTTPQSSGPHIE